MEPTQRFLTRRVRRGENGRRWFVRLIVYLKPTIDLSHATR